MRCLFPLTLAYI